MLLGGHMSCLMSTSIFYSVEASEPHLLIEGSGRLGLRVVCVLAASCLVDCSVATCFGQLPLFRLFMFSPSNPLNQHNAYLPGLHWFLHSRTYTPSEPQLLAYLSGCAASFC